MGLSMRCDVVDRLPENLNTDICGISAVKWRLSVCLAIGLLGVGIYLLQKWKYRCHKTLLTFHNLRAAVALLLLVINTLELARALLPNRQKDAHEAALLATDHVAVFIGAGLLWNALAALLLTFVLMWYHRMVELKKAVAYLHVSAVVAALMFLVRIFELAEVVYYENVYELEPCLQGSTALCFLGLSVLDGFTIYKERYRPDYLEDYEKIGYKHTLATFYSKAVFWWLTPLLWFGYKEPLELEDLGQMRLEDSARAHYDQFLLIYKTAKVKNGDRPPSLWLCYLKSSWRMFTLGGVLKLCGDLFALIGPLAIQQIVQYIESMYAAAHATWPQTNSNNNSGGSSFSFSHDYNGSSNVGGGVGGDNNNHSSITRWAFQNLYDNSNNNSNNYNNNNKTGSNKSLSSIGFNGANHIGLLAAAATNWISNVVGGLPRTADTSDISSDNNNQIAAAAAAANGIDYNGTEVKIYYASWLDLVSNGWAVAWIVLLAALAQGALSQASTHILNMTGIRIKTSLQGLIYRKTLLLNSSVGQAGDNDNDDGQAAVRAGAARVGGKGVAGKNGDAGERLNENNTSAQKTAQQHRQPPQPPQQPQKRQKDQQKNASALSDVGAITNLMSEDALNVMSFFWIVHYVWSIPLKIAVVMYLLYLKLGVSAIIGSFACILIMTPLQFLIGKAMSTNTERVALRLRWRRAAYCLWRLCLLRAAFATFFVKFTDERLQTIHYTLMGIKIIKLNVWTDIFIKRVREVREKELKYLGLDSFYWTLMTILTHISSVLITFITLAAYVRLENDRLEFTASRLFSALALFQQLTVPLLIFPITVPIILSAIVSTRRLERFLGAREIHKQFEGIRHMARILSKSDASLDYYEIKGQSKSMAPAPRTVLPPINCEHKQNERPTLKLHLPESPAPLAQSEPQTPLSQLPPEPAKTGVNDNAAEKPAPPCVCDNECLLQHYESRAKQLSQHRRELLRNSPYVVIRPRKFPNAHVQLLSATQQTLHKKLDSWRRDSLLLKMPEDMAVSVRDACFVWNPQRFEEPLSVKNVTIPKGRLTVIVGENGSGKTSFLSALLMEMPLISGDIIWNKTSTIAFVPQQPWLLNANIRENILFGEPFRPRRYDFVLEACALKPDIELMPDADFTVIGERGINLSGGQRQRVAIARALYSSANVVIMDDPLSSLDNEVSRHIFEQSIKRMLLKVNRTVILVTQQLQLTQHADYLIVMKDRHLQASGSYKEIELRQPHIVAKWNAIIAKAHEKEQASQATALARTAQERWKLYKNVTKMGLQRSASTMRRKSSAGSDTAADGFQRGGALTTATSTVAAADSVDDAAASVVGRLAEEDEDEEDDVDETDDLLPVSLPSVGKNIGERRSMSGSLRSVGSFRSSIYGSRHLFYDAPLPIDECQTEDVIMRRRSNRHRRAATQRRRQQQQQRPLSIASTASSRLSGVSSDASECRRSFFTGSCSSGNSYGSYQSGVSADSRHSTVSADSECEPQRLRVHTWQPQSATAVGALAQHQPVARNASSPGRLPSQTAAQQPAEARTSDAALVAELVQSNANKSADAVSGFQQFLRRMSMRRSAVHRRHRTSSARNSIVSITEETTPVTTPTSTSLPSIELSAVPSAGVVAAEGGAESTTTTETDSWIVNIENEESVPDQVHIDYKMLTNMTRAGKQSTVTMNADAGAAGVQRGRRAVRGLGVGLPDTAIKTPAVASQQQQQQQLPGYDAERKYGKIPMQIYLLYLRASGWPIVLLFCVTALIWQGMRVYTDVWLQHWTDGNDNAAASATATFMGSVNDTYGSTSMPLPTAAAAHYNNSNNGHEQHRIVAATNVTYYFRIYAAISCVCIVMAVLSTPAGQMAGCNARRHLHDKLLLSIMRRSLHFFQVTPLGRLMNRFGNDMAIIDKKIAATSQRLLQFTLLCLCAVLINVSITPWFMLLTVPICAAYYIIQKFYRSSARELQRIENATNSPVISHLAETIQGVTTIRAYNQETRFTEILFKRLEANTIAFTILNTSNRWLGISLDFLGGVIVFVAIVTALLAATISCSNYQQELHDKHANTSTDTNSNSSSQSHTYGDNQRTASAELTPTPSLVGLAINYTLLMPIYLNWVVKLLADMEMYVGSVERIAHYAEMDADAAADMTAAADAEMQAVIVKDAAGNSGEGNVAVAPLTAAGDDVKEPLTAGNDQPVVARAAGKSTRSTCMPWVHSDVQRINFCHHHQPVPISWPKRGDITFENVSLRYEGQMEHVIKNLTLKIPYGQKIGVCGRTGSGKSSLALSLFGVLQATSGRIIIDDVDITKIHPDEMCSRLSIIPQDAYLFNTIRENLDPTCFYAMPELQRCLDMVGLLDVVYAQPESIDAAIGEGGGLQLNAGQRQMLCLARAILRGSVCLIMDEATSSLDAGAEKTLMAAAHNAFKGRTIITIAHRLSTILDYDRIIVLENGRIIEDDSPQQLLQRSEGAFYALLNSGRMFGATTGVGAGPVVGVLTDLPEREAAPAAAAAASSRK